MTATIRDQKIRLLVLVIVILFIAAMVAGVLALSAQPVSSCTDLAKAMNTAFHADLLGQCQVKMGSTWVIVNLRH